MDQNTKSSDLHHLKHWQHVYKKKRRHANYASAKNMAIAQLMTIFGAIIAGLILDSNKLTLAAMTGSFLLLPAIFDLSSSVGASLSAKINHRIVEGRGRKFKLFIKATLFAFFIGLLSGVLVSLIGAAFANLIFEASFIKVFVLGVGSISLCMLIGFPIVGYSSMLLIKKGINPDDVIGPIETALFYILAVASISLISGALL